MGSLKDHVVIVTGGAQGIGRAYCEGLIGEGARVVVADIDAAKAEATKQDLIGKGAEAASFGLDVSKEKDAKRLAEFTLAQFGRIDALVNNAAVFQRPNLSRVPFEQIGVDEWDRVIAVNLRGVFLCCQAVAPIMKEQRSGKLVNISSAVVMAGPPLLAHYVASKAGVIGLTRTLARELGEFNICVNAVAPGYTVSLEDADEEVMTRVQQTAQFAMQTRCIKRVQTPDDLVGTIIFLCSQASDFITGQTIVVDGGTSMI